MWFSTDFGGLSNLDYNKVLVIKTFIKNNLNFFPLVQVHSIHFFQGI